MRVRSRFQALLLAGLLAAAIPGLRAQQPAPPAAPANAALTDRIPLDPAITTGTFKNGLTYFIRTTKRPEKRAELRLVVNAGSILEQDELCKRFLPQITLAEVNALAKDWVPDRNRVITISAPEKDGVPDEKRLASVIALVSAKDIKPYVETLDAAPLLDPLPSPGSILKTTTTAEFGITEWDLANGVTVVLKPTDFREDEILFRASRFGGTSLASDADDIPAATAVQVVSAGGLGRFSAIDLPKIMTGKQATVGVSIGPYEEGLNGGSTKKDLETMFQLIYLRFTQPRADPTSFGVMRNRLKSSLALQASSPAFAFGEALASALRQNHLRTRPLTAETVGQMNLDTSLAFYKERFADANGLTFVFVGSIGPAAMRPLVERYLGSLPSTRRTQTWKDTGIRYAQGVVERRVDKGIEPQSRAALVFTGPFRYNQTERVAIRALGDLLDTRLRETLREDLGGTYGVSVAPTYAQVPVEEYAVNINFACAPDRTEELIKAALQQIDLIKANGPTDQQVADVREKLLRDNETNMKQNGYLVGQLILRYEYSEDIGTLFGLADYYRKLTPAALQEAATTYLNPQNMVKVTLFPEKKH